MLNNLCSSKSQKQGNLKAFMGNLDKIMGNQTK